MAVCNQLKDLRLDWDVIKESIVLLVPERNSSGQLKHSGKRMFDLHLSEKKQKKQRFFRGVLGVYNMSLQLIVTQCTMQYLISAGFPNEQSKTVPFLRCGFTQSSSQRGTHWEGGCSQLFLFCSSIPQQYISSDPNGWKKKRRSKTKHCRVVQKLIVMASFTYDCNFRIQTIRLMMNGFSGDVFHCRTTNNIRTVEIHS